MQKSLLIVESPAKAKTLGKYLGPNFEVLASVGHIKNLPQSKLGVDIENGFEPQYKVIAGKKAVLKRIKDSAKTADAIYLAPDPDREGEAIAFHLAQELGDDKPIYRVLFHEIIKSAVQKAIDNPTKLDVHKYNSQQARRVLDRLVGYLISPILWDKVRRGLSAGRVQSVAVKLIVDREREIQSFIPVEYWSLGAVVLGQEPPSFKCRLHRMDSGKKVEIDNGETAHRIRDEIQNASLKVKEITRKDRRRNPSAPFITSTLQQEAARKLGFSAKRTMRVAQQLYEGIEIGAEGPEGLITYMRTDSTRISKESLEELRAYIKETFGPENLPKTAKAFKSRKSSQDAHEAIRVTGVARTPTSLKPFLDKDQFRLYELIWKRYVSCQMSSAIYDAMTIDIEAGNHILRATGARLKFAGFMAVYIEGVDDESEGGDKEQDGLLPALEAGQSLTLEELEAVQHFTQPPPRFSEPALIRVLEEQGIGRPSTYASILSNVIDRHYVEKESRRLKPTELGVVINDMLIEQFPNLFSETFTATMEEELDQVAEGDLPWRSVLERYYGELAERIEYAKEHMQDLKRAGVATDHVCEECGNPMVLKWGRNGQFLACTGYPECKNTKEARIDVMGKIEIEEPEKVEEPCPKCGSELMVKRGKFGKFIACTNYPDCDHTSNYAKDIPGGKVEDNPDGPKVGDVQGTCPQCGSDMTVKRSRYGLFLGCSSYPDCKKTKRLPKKKKVEVEDDEGEVDGVAAKAPATPPSTASSQA